MPGTATRYGASILTDVEIVDEGGAPVSQHTIATTYDLRHCSFKRGAWTSSGWYTPGWGALNAVIGFFMIGYDPASTVEFQQAVGPTYGQFVARQIFQMAASKPMRGDVVVPMPAAAAPVVSAPVQAPVAVPGQVAPSPAAPAVSQTVPAAVASERTVVEQLQELKRRRDAGEMAEGDYVAARKKLIIESIPAAQ